MSLIKVPLKRPLVSVHVRQETSAAVPLGSPEPEPLAAAPAVSQPVAPPSAPPSTDEFIDLLDSIHHAVLELQDRRHQSLDELQQVAVDLAISVVSRILHDAFIAERVDIERLIQSVINDLPTDSSVIVWLNPEDNRTLRESTAKPDSTEEQRAVELREDAQLGRGDYRIETSEGTWLSRIPDFLAKLRRHLVEGLDDAQIERRQTEAAHRGMRRFPDRRHSA